MCLRTIVRLKYKEEQYNMTLSLQYKLPLRTGVWQALHWPKEPVNPGTQARLFIRNHIPCTMYKKSYTMYHVQEIIYHVSRFWKRIFFGYFVEGIFFPSDPMERDDSTFSCILKVSMIIHSCENTIEPKTICSEKLPVMDNKDFSVSAEQPFIRKILTEKGTDDNMIKWYK